MIADMALERVALDIRHDLRPYLSATLAHAEHDGLARSASALDLPLAGDAVHVARLAADVALVYLYLAIELVEAPGLHGEANALEHEPSGLLRDTECAAQLVRADPILGVRGQPHGGEPLVQP